MSNARDSLSERNVDLNKPSTSSTLQPQCSKSSISNKVKEKSSIPKKSPQKSAMSKQKHDESNLGTNNATLVEDVSSKVENLGLGNETEDVDQSSKPKTFKKKNARKKEKLKNLQLSASNVNIQTPMSPNGSNFSIPNGAPIQEYFLRCVSPMYAAASSSYLENLTYHPQFQYMQPNVQFVDILKNATSAPNTPLAFMQNKTTSSKTAHGKSEPSTPKFLQNVMQHPLLSQSYKDKFNVHTQRKHLNKSSEQSNQEEKQSPRRQRKRSDELPEGRKFDPYISLEEVEQGLKDNTLIEGVLRINPKLFQNSYVSSTDRSEQDIFIDGLKNRNRALEGDIIVVKLIDSDNEETNDNGLTKQKRGKVVYIKEKKHTRTCIGNLKLMADKSRQKALFIPRDHRIPRLNIPFTCWPDNFYQDHKKYENTLFLAKIEDWFDTRFALGKILRNIGQSGDMVTETRAILAQTDLDITPYGPDVRHLYPRLDYTIPEEEIKIREDCRKLCIFSIDPASCRDIDDAISCRELDNGNYEVGVHISDVSHFLTENTLLDEKVAEKATTIYLVERAYHMLPDELCMLCSLFPGVDKLSFSVFWEMNDNAEVFSHRFAKTIIHSCAQLAYDHAQAILDDSKDAEKIFPETYNGYKYEDIKKTIKTFGKITSILRKKRFDGGALKIDQPKVSFKLNTENGLPESFWLYENKESHQLIEELMLLANMTVANRIYEDHPNLAFLRSHPPPSGYMMKQLAKALQPMGINIEISSAGALHKSLNEYINQDRGRAMVLNMLCAKPMTRAKYFCAHGTDDDEFQHYALNVPLYTHFTSPIRRYADIMVHRLLAASIHFRDIPDWDVDKVRMVAAQCNKQKYNAKKAGELSTELYTLKYIELNSPMVTEAVVVEVREKYIDTIVVAMGLNRRIFFNTDFPGEFQCIKNDAGSKLSKMEVLWNETDNLPMTKQIIEVFSILEIEMVKGDESNMGKVETKLVRPH